MYGQLCTSLAFKDPHSKALVARNTGCPLSPKVIIIILAKSSHCPFSLYVSVPHHVVSYPGPKNDQCPSRNFLAWSATPTELAIHISLLRESPHMMSLFIDMKMMPSFELFMVTIHIVHHSVNLGENLQRSESWENIPLEFCWFSVDSIQFSFLVGALEPIQFAVPCSIVLWIWRRLSETQNRILQYMDFCRQKSDCFVTQ